MFASFQSPEAATCGGGRWALQTGRLLALIPLLGIAPLARAVDITFSGGEPNLSHYQSDTTTPIPTDGSFQFEIGVFDDGYVPSAHPASEWPDHWNALPGADSITDFTTLGSIFGSFPGFNSTTVFTNNASPYGVAKQVYVWGFDRRTGAGGAQWILMTNSATWVLPDGNSQTANAETWTIGNAAAGETLIGSVSASRSMTLGDVTLDGGGGGGGASIAASDAYADEDAGTVDFTVELSAPLGAPSSVDYDVVALSAAAGDDFTVASGTVNFTAGDTSEPLSVVIAEDLYDEVNETFKVMFSNPQGATLADGEAIGTIIDNDLPPTISIGTALAAENSGSVQIPVTLSMASGKGISAEVGLGPGTLIEGTDFSGTPSSIIIPAGSTTAMITLTLFDDSLPEIDKDRVVFIDNPVDATLGVPLTILHVSDDDALAQLEGTGSLSIDPVSGDVTISWDAVAGRTYHVLTSVDLANWAVLPGAEAIVAGSASEAFVHPGGSIRAFYMVVDGPAPTP